MTEEDVTKWLHDAASFMKARCEEAFGDLEVTEGFDRDSVKQDFQAELVALLAREKEGLLGGGELRRIAELVELLDGEKAAMPWWRRAIQSGDPISILMDREASE